jgi:periplasmic protein TonB
MANQVLVQHPKSYFSNGHPTVVTHIPKRAEAVPSFRLLAEVRQGLLSSLFGNLRDALFPERLPPLRLTSRPVAVREIWSRGQRKKANKMSAVLHVLGIGALIGLPLLGTRSQPVVVEHENVTLIAPPLSDYQPVMQPKIAPKALAGGGGGGEHAKVFESKGHLPKVAPQQFTPPTVEIRDQKPKLAMEPTVVAPPNVKLPDTPTMPNLGNPMSARVTGPASNGPGTGGGIGSGKNDGVGSGSGPGHGPGQGGGFGGGVYSMGDIGITAPVAKFTPSPDFSEEARKAKYQGTVILSAIIGPDGRPRNLHVVRSLGMGLDEKALDRVRTWLFEPGKKNGQPVSVAMQLEVDFRLF